MLPLNNVPDDFDGSALAQPVRRSSMIWVSFGFAALFLGAIGAILPLLPTTPFVIVAAFAFGKGSPRLRRWLVNHRLFGPAIREWEAHGAIRRPYNYLACGLMALTFAGSALAGLAPIVLALQALCMIPAALYVLTRPGSPHAGRTVACNGATQARHDP